MQNLQLTTGEWVSCSLSVLDKQIIVPALLSVGLLTQGGKKRVIEGEPQWNFNRIPEYFQIPFLCDKLIKNLLGELLAEPTIRKYEMQMIIIKQ
ncbi:hypothetical protein HK096_011078, partial [Nowakowskiella sp. JEL0078]